MSEVMQKHHQIDTVSEAATSLLKFSTGSHLDRKSHNSFSKPKLLR